MRPDDDAVERALAEVLESTGMTRAQAVQLGLRREIERTQARKRRIADAESLAGDDSDRAEVAAVARMMEHLRAPW